MRDFKRLKVWEKAHDMTLAVYKASRTFPASELYGLTSQLRRSCASIPANIAEGAGRGSEKEMARYFQISAGSASETEYHLLLAHDLGFLDDQSYTCLLDELSEVKRMLHAYASKLKAAQ
jgi:four helix bundle protein